MRALLAIARRELADRGALAILTVLFSIAPLIGMRAGWWDAASGGSVALVLFTALAVISTLILGASVIGRDLGDGRLAFFFSRPVPWWAIWGGKLLAGFVLAALSIVVLAPVLIAEHGLARQLRVILDARGALLFTAWLILGLCLAHAVVVIYRSRSRWAALDLVLLASTALWIMLLVQRVRSVNLWYGFGNIEWGLRFLAVIFLAASAAQMAFGRVSARRGRFFLSMTLWGLLTPCVIGYELYFGSLLDVKRSDVTRVIWARPASRGPWMWLGIAGESPRRYAPAIFNVVDRAFYSMGMARAHGSTNGRWAVWAKTWPTLLGASSQVFVADLERRPLEPIPLPVKLDPAWKQIEIAAAGDRLLIIKPSSLLDVYDLPSGRLLRSFRMPRARRIHAFFDSSEKVRAYLNGAQSRDSTHVVEILELDVAQGRTEEMGRIETSGNPRLRISPSGSRLIAIDQGGDVGLYDARSGRLMSTWRATSRIFEWFGIDADFLGDDRAVVLEPSTEGVRLHVLSAQGASERTVDLEARGMASFGPEIMPGRLIVGCSSPAGSWLLVDLATGRVERHEPGRMLGMRWASWLGPYSRPVPGSQAAGCFVVDNRLVSLNAQTGDLRVLLGRPTP